MASQKGKMGSAPTFSKPISIAYALVIVPNPHGA